MRTYIYHINSTRDYPMYGTNAEKKDYVTANRESYTKVAELSLNSNDLDVAYSATQNGMDSEYSSWVDLANAYQDNTTFTNPKETRSSMVGDIICKEGVEYIVDINGFLEVN